MDAAAYMGDRSQFYVRISGVEKPVAVSIQNRGQPKLLGEGHQGQVWLSWPDDAIVLHNADSNQELQK